MARIERTALLPYSALQMYDLVNDVESYPQYMSGCVAAKVLEHTPEEMVATMSLSRLGLSYTITTRNRLVAGEVIDMSLVEGPFDRFSGGWRFQALAEDACKVVFTMDFHFRSAVVAKVAEKWFESVANELVDGVCRRAGEVYRAV